VNIPQTTFACDGCDKELNILSPYLRVQVKPQVEVIQASDKPASGDMLVPVSEISLGTRSGRGKLLRFHNFRCAGKWFDKRRLLEPKLEPHHEDGEPYVPEDNRSIKELVKAGELPESAVAFHKSLADFVPGGDEQ
jgi:hypothetical protein